MGVPLLGFEVFALLPTKGGGYCVSFWLGTLTYLDTNFLNKQIRNYSQDGPQGRNEWRLQYFANSRFFLSDYFDFQPACLSQFKYEANVYWDWEAIRFKKSKLNLSILVLFEAGKAKEF